METSVQSAFLDVATISTLTGASLSVTLVANVANYVFEWNPRWFGLLLSFAISVGLTLTTSHAQLIDWVVCIIRAFQIYATAVGIAAMSASRLPKHKNLNPQRSSVTAPRKIFSDW